MKNRIMRRLLKGKRGQAFAEFAIVLPALLVIVGMTVSYAQVLFVHLSMQMCAYEGARTGVTNPDATSANNAVHQTIQNFSQNLPFVTPNNISITDFPQSTWNKGNGFDVSTSYTLNILFPVPGTSWVPGAPVTVKGHVVLAIENGP